MSRRSCLYEGQVIHTRTDQHRDHFAYPIAFFGFDTAELDQLDRDLRLFGHNRRALFGLRDRDYAQGGGGLGRAAIGFARAGGVTAAIDRVELLTQARVAGYGFNPVSFYLLFGGARLVCAIAEINNTYGGRHRYLLDDAVRQPDGRYRTDKTFYVSPYIHRAAAYLWTVRVEGDRREIAVDVVDDADQRFFRAVLRGRRRPLSDRELARTAIRYPLQTVQIIGLIHWHAFRLRRRGVSHHPPPFRDTSS